MRDLTARKDTSWNPWDSNSPTPLSTSQESPSPRSTYSKTTTHTCHRTRKDIRAPRKLLLESWGGWQMAILTNSLYRTQRARDSIHPTAISPMSDAKPWWRQLMPTSTLSKRRARTWQCQGSKSTWMSTTCRSGLTPSYLIGLAKTIAASTSSLFLSMLRAPSPTRKWKMCSWSAPSTSSPSRACIGTLTQKSWLFWHTKVVPTSLSHSNPSCLPTRRAAYQQELSSSWWSLSVSLVA